jgi:hypothetical protein
MPCLLLRNAENEPNRKSPRPNSTHVTKENSVPGSLLFSAEASHLALNPVFQLKAVLVAAGLINVAIYQFWAKPAVEHLAPGSSMPARAKVTGALSLIIWIAVAACGRSIAHF